MSAKDLVNEVINKAKNTKEFQVIRTLPESFEFMGVIPFDVKIKEGKITAQILAVTKDEANTKLDAWLEDCTLR
jgi:hypothetical protein